MLGSNSSFFPNKFISLSFKFVKCYMGLYVWETILSETLTKMNKLNDNVSKLIDKRRNWNEHSHSPECPGQNWKRIKKMEWRGDENGRKNLKCTVPSRECVASSVFTGHANDSRRMRMPKMAKSNIFAGNVRKKFQTFFEIPAELKTAPKNNLRTPANNWRTPAHVWRTFGT